MLNKKVAIAMSGPSINSGPIRKNMPNSIKSKLGERRHKVAIAMSGGVDSSVAAALLKEQGYDCLGLFMKFWAEGESKLENKCCSLEAVTDARKVCQRLNIPFYVLNFKNEFKKEIVDDFLKQSKNGLTPNPCVRCNKLIKFDLLLKKAKALGCDYLATGHYIKIRKKKTDNSLTLLQAKDLNKDQSYFLYNLRQNQLKHLLFPLSNLTKPAVRELAKKYKLPVYQKSESQEICFVPDKTHYPFLKRHLKLKTGRIIDTGGKVLGVHEGLPLYTLGQRKGIKVGGIGPFYVVEINYEKNILVVSRDENDRRLFAKKFKIKSVGWITGQAPDNSGLGVKIRYQAKTISARISGDIVTLKKPQRAIMPGQSAVFYHGQQLLGGGIVEKVY